MIYRALLKNFQKVYTTVNWFQLRFTPTGQVLLCGLIAAAIFGFNTQKSLTYQVFALLFSLFIIAMIGVRFSRPRLSAERTMPPTATVAQPFSYRVRITNLTNTQQRDLVFSENVDFEYPGFEEFHNYRDALSLTENPVDRRIGYPRWLRLVRAKQGVEVKNQPLPPLPAKADSVVKVTIIPGRRGYIRFSGIKIGCPDLFGLFRGVNKVPADDTLLVLPRSYSIPNINLPKGRRYQQGGVSLASSVGESMEFTGLRDYQPGDPVRHIHWRSLAKINKPVVRKYEDEFFVRHALVLDCFAGNMDSSLFEEAVSLAASFAQGVYRPDSLLDLLFTSDKTYRFTAGRGLSHVQALLEVLACIEPYYEDRFDQLAIQIMHNAGEFSALICVFLQWDDKRESLLGRLRDSGITAVTFLICNDSRDKNIKRAKTKGIPHVYCIESGKITEEFAGLRINVNERPS